MNKMRHRFISTWLLIGLFLVPVSGNCENKNEYKERIEKGSINWTRGTIQAKGVGVCLERNNEERRSQLIKTAREEALRHLLEVAKRVRVNSTAMVGDLFAGNSAIASKVAMMIKQAPVVTQEFFTDGTVNVTVRMNLYGGFSQLVLPQEIKQVQSVIPIGQDIEKGLPSSSESPITRENSRAEIYTGLVVDARRLDVKAALSIKIVDENGKEVYGPAFVSREFAVQRGMSAYARDLEEAKSALRVSDDPLVVKGLRTQTSRPCDIVISNADASMIRSASAHLSFLKRCRVMIVVD